MKIKIQTEGLIGCDRCTAEGPTRVTLHSDYMGGLFPTEGMAVHSCSLPAGWQQLEQMSYGEILCPECLEAHQEEGSEGEATTRGLVTIHDDEGMDSLKGE